MKHCQTCKHWHRYDGPWGSCKAVMQTKERMPDEIVQISVIDANGVYHEDGDVVLETKGAFGCILHEEADGKKPAEETRYDSIYIDVPDAEAIRCGGVEGYWTNMEILKHATLGEAVGWIEKHIGPCDAEGRVGLVTLGTPTDDHRAEEKA